MRAPCKSKGWLGLLVAMVLGLILGACTKNEVRLTFELPKDVNEACRIVYYASGANVATVRETVVQIAAGKGEAVLPLRYPAVVYLFSPSQRNPAAIIYAERGDRFFITGPGPDVGSWEVRGTETAEDLSTWRIENSDLIRSRESAPEKLNAAVAKYVKAHPESPSAVIILYHYFSRRGHEKEFYKLQGAIDRSITGDEELMGALSPADLLTDLPDTPQMPRSIVLTGDSGYADTLRPAAGKGAMLMFRAPNDGGVNNDSVKALLERLSKQKGAVAAVAELYADPDTFSWRRYLRKDTVKGLMRLWLPLGVADSLAIEAGVRRMPYYIVTGPKGKELYRGDDWQKAVDAVGR